MTDQTALDLSTVLDAIRDDLAAKFPAIGIYVAEDVDEVDGAPLPAALLQLLDIAPRPDDNPLNGQFACEIHVELSLILGRRTHQVRRKTVQAAGAIAAAVNGERFGVRWGAAVVVDTGPDEFAPAAQQFDVWRVEWVHDARVGVPVDLELDDLPAEVLTSWAPEIGAAHEDKYEAQE